ncbi:hypothetical protein EWB00_001908 [Schistosoma japonicum]|uniref:Uncharacterized protein n=1 Tax=Schistosoma japonicum TaxID=6182 RepID=A0A4Z2DE04_SCHJA|nr:hypothetical protein EWB00_001908 [Schistosoma japonicum]
MSRLITSEKLNDIVYNDIESMILLENTVPPETSIGDTCCLNNFEILTSFEYSECFSGIHYRRMVLISMKFTNPFPINYLTNYTTIIDQLQDYEDTEGIYYLYNH